MKMKRITALSIILVLVAGIAVFYFSNQDRAVDIMMGNYDWENQENRPQYFDELVWTVDDEYGYEGEYIEGATSEEIIQNLELGKSGSSIYSLVIRDTFDKHPTNNRYFGYYYQLREQVNEGSESFYVDRTEVVKNGARNEITRTYQNISSGKFHTLPLAYFWILPEGIDPKNAIAAMMTAQSNMRTGCVVEPVPYYEDYHGAAEGQADVPLVSDKPMQYQVSFDLTKLDTGTLQQLSNQVVKSPCGPYGPAQMTSYEKGTFVTQHDVLIYIPYESPFYADAIVRIVKTLN